ncbi:hypothetical protein [uncultured Gammaproteobacteria bacterium]|nr:hypothetical protein [uncultured Gammaproteobacteria bacterium]
MLLPLSYIDTISFLSSCLYDAVIHHLSNSLLLSLSYACCVVLVKASVKPSKRCSFCSKLLPITLSIFSLNCFAFSPSEFLPEINFKKVVSFVGELFSRGGNFNNSNKPISLNKDLISACQVLWFDDRQLLDLILHTSSSATSIKADDGFICVISSKFNFCNLGSSLSTIFLN